MSKCMVCAGVLLSHEVRSFSLKVELDTEDEIESVIRPLCDKCHNALIDICEEDLGKLDDKIVKFRCEGKS